MAAGQAGAMGYRDVFWYKEGIAGWGKTHNFIESSDYSYATRKIPAPLTARELQAKLQSDARYILVDIRDEKSRKKLGSIAGPALEFPVYRLHLNYNELPEDKILVLYDIRAKQAPAAIRYLLKKRFYFINLTYLKGGITAWKDQNLPMGTP
jgi:rhodanese-related sulfurtransferase